MTNSLANATAETNNGILYADAVLEGGGVRGIGHVGALVEAEKRGYRWVNVAGTSAGAIVASLMAADYTATEMYEIMNNVNFKQFADSDGFNWFYARQLFNFAIRGGIHPGKYAEEFVKSHLAEKGKTKFGDLIIPGQEHLPKNSPQRYRLTVIASDISTGRMVRLPRDAQTYYGIDPDDVEIARAVHMSLSIPFFFIPVSQQYIDGRMCRIVDGGLLSNFPISIFDVHDTEPSRPTFGFRLVDQVPPANDTDPVIFTPTGNAYQIGQALLHTMLTAHDRLYMDDHTYVRTIAIPTNGISSTRFNLSDEEKLTLYQNGQTAAQTFFQTWDFEAYKVAYRSGKPLPSRQERLHENMKTIKRNTNPLFLAS
jgi:NTE family protein